MSHKDLKLEEIILNSTGKGTFLTLFSEWKDGRGGLRVEEKVGFCATPRLHFGSCREGDGVFTD